MRADSLGRWYARFAVVSALGAAALAFAAGPASAEIAAPCQQAAVDGGGTSATTLVETDWGAAPADQGARLLETDWG
ncbi:MAG TPA: hypothetical protein VHN18_20405 [Micromonosporaceae bacterium]|nr:hypothetical protein [Micromonosporaceae bacterium]